MPTDATNSEMIVAVGVGAVAGMGGAAVTALSENMTRKQVAATVISGLGFGSFVPPAAMTLWNFHPILAGIIGFVCGLTAVGLVTGVKKIGDMFGKKPGAFIPQIKGAMTEDSPAGTIPGGK